MNVIREIGRINDRELALGGDGISSSWHDDYKDSAYIFVGGLPYDLTEGDVITIFSQFGEIMDINMPRDKETHKGKGFSFLMYEDQRSTVLAVDNLNGAKVLGRTLRVDHVKSYRHPDQRNEEGERVEVEEPTYNAMPPIIGEESGESSGSDRNSADEEDPMAEYIRAQKKAEKKVKKEKSDKKKRKHDGESKEERKARKLEKRERKQLHSVSDTYQRQKSREDSREYDRERHHRRRSESRDRYRHEDRDRPPRERRAEIEYSDRARDRDVQDDRRRRPRYRSRSPTDRY